MNLAISVSLLLPCLPHLSEDPFTRFELEGGVQVQVLHIEDAERQCTFTFLEFGLLDDRAGRAQWSHLVEHALIRWHDGGPAELELRANGETRGGTMHLESLAPIARWQDSLAMQVRWLSFTGIDAGILEREIGRVLGEVDSTEGVGYTHKWALAGAAQVLLHGRDHARVRGDVSDATPDALADYVRQVVPLDHIRICTAGPATPDEVRELLAALMAQRSVLAPTHPADEAPADQPITAGDRAATWDLGVAHYLEVYPLPIEGCADRLAAEVLAQLVTLRVMDRSRPGLASAAVEDFGGLGTCLVISFGGLTETREQLRERVAQAIQPMAAGKGLAQTPMAAFGLRRQFTVMPDLGPLRESMRGRPGADVIEGQLALNMAGFELRTGYLLPELNSAFEQVNAERVGRLARVLGPKARRSVFLAPAKEKE